MCYKKVSFWRFITCNRLLAYNLKSVETVKKKQEKKREKEKKTSQSHLIVTHIPFMTWKCGRAVKISPPCIKFPPIIMIMLISAVVSQWDQSLFEVLPLHAMVSRFHEYTKNACNGFTNSRSVTMRPPSIWS